MNIELKLAVIFLMSVLLTACVTSPLKAPCNEKATLCGTKIKINQW